MSCKKCSKKGIGINCKYCLVEYCTSCIQLEIHECTGIDNKIKDELINLKTKLEFEKDKKVKV